MKTGVIFDMDGTLVDTLEDLCDATNYALGKHGYPLRTVDEVRRFVGNGASRLIQLAVPEGEDPVPVLKDFRIYYKENNRAKTRAYDGIAEAIAALQVKYPLAVVTNKPDFAAKAISEVLFLDVYTLGEVTGVPRKPAPDMIYQAMRAIGVERCVYVGDSEVDLATARNAGVPCVSVLWGFREKAELEASGADCFCDDPKDLPDIIEKVIARNA